MSSHRCASVCVVHVDQDTDRCMNGSIDTMRLNMYKYVGARVWSAGTYETFLRENEVVRG